MSRSVDSVIEISCNRHLRGPFTAASALLRLIVPDLLASQSGLVHGQAAVINAIAPDLCGVVPPPAGTLTTNAAEGERTRYFSSARPRFLAYGVALLVCSWAAARHSDHTSICFRDVPEADPTDLALIEILTARCQSDRLSISRADTPPTGRVASDARSFVDSDGTLIEPAADLGNDPEQRRSMHTARAQLLANEDAPGTDLGAIPYHLERGLDPKGAGADALLHVLEYCFNSGFYDAAVDAAKRGLRLVDTKFRPDLHSRFTLRLISALSSLGHAAEATERVHAHLRETTAPADHMQCCYALAMLLTRQSGGTELPKALAWANTGIALADSQQDPTQRAFDGAFMRNARALVELRMGNTTGALELVREAIRLTDAHLPPNEHLLHRTVLIHNRARVNLVLGDLDSALQDFSVVVERDPEYEDALFDRARAHTALGNLEAALADYGRAIELRDTFVEAFYNRAEILLQMGHTSAARADLDAVLAIDADHVPALTNRAGIQIEDGLLDGAEADTRHGLSLQPDSPELLCVMGLLQSEHGDADHARHYYDRALQVDPDCVQALGNRAILHYTEGRFDYALADLDRAISNERTPQLLLNRGIALQELGRHQAAIVDFDAALAGEADTREALFRRGASLFAVGDLSGARADWEAHLMGFDPGTSSEHAKEIARVLATA